LEIITEIFLLAIMSNERDKTEPMGWLAKQKSLESITGGSFAGKTDELLRRLCVADLAGQDVSLFVWGKDDAEKAVVGSHAGKVRNRKAICVKSASDIFNYVNSLPGNPLRSIVAVDDAHFFDPDLTGVLNELADRGYRVIVAGLDKDSNGESYEVMARIMATAEDVNKLRAICNSCGEIASNTVKVSDEFEARCRQHT